MGDFAQFDATPLSITSWSEYGPLGDARSLNLSPNGASASWPSANRAIYIPVSIPFTYQVKQAFWGNGATAAGNSSFAIVSAIGGQRLFTTGAVANSGASALQYVSVDWLLYPGSYYFALSNDGTASRSWLSSSVSTNFGRHMGMRQQATAHPIPATITPAAWASTGFPLCGITRV